MGKYMKKCRGVGEVAAMEVTQVVGVRTRSRAAAAAAAAAAAEEEEEEEEAKKTNEAAAAAEAEGEGEGEVEGYLELRSRRLAMATRTPRSTANSRSGGGGGGCPSRRASKGTISRCSSNASSDAAGVHETTSAAAAAAEEEEIKDDDARHAGSGEPEGCNDLESSVSYTECSRERRRETTPLSELRDAESEQRRKRRRSDPSEAEIEEFFAAPERGEAARFAAKYNFDVVNEVPLDGRYEWVRLSS